MGNAIKTNYMESPNLGYSEYFVKSKTDLSAISPKQGDRAIVADEGKIYLCVTQGEWEKFGNSIPSGNVTIETTINSESTNDDVAGAKAVWDLAEENKITIATTIDSTSSNEDAASAQATYEYGQSLKTTIATTINSSSINSDAAGAAAVYNFVNTQLNNIHDIKYLSGNQTIELVSLNNALYSIRDINTLVKVYTKYDLNEYILLKLGLLIPMSETSDIRNFMFLGWYYTSDDHVHMKNGVLIVVVTKSYTAFADGY